MIQSLVPPGERLQREREGFLGGPGNDWSTSTMTVEETKAQAEEVPHLRWACLLAEGF